MKKMFISILIVCFFAPGWVYAKNVRMNHPCLDVATLKTDGSGDNRTKKRGGNYASIALNTLGPDQVIRVIREAGELKYVTLHGRYQGGIWRTIYQGPMTEFPVSQYLSSQMKDSSCTHVVISVNGAHEKYEPIPCQAVVKVCGDKVNAMDHGSQMYSDCRNAGTLKTDGSGDNRTKKRGGNYVSIALNTLEPDQVIRVIRGAGELKYVTLHGRYQGGIWRTIYQGPITEFPVSQYLSSQMKDSRCTNVVISANGSHEKYEPIPCQAEVKVCRISRNDHDMEKDCRNAGTLKTDGSGDNRTKKRGGNYVSIALNTLEPGQVIRVIRGAGELKYVTLHGRYQGGIWQTIYQGPITEFPVGQYLSSQMKDSRCTNVVISANGAHEKYEPIPCQAVVKVCGGKSGGKPGNDYGMEKGCRDAGTLKTDGSGDNRTKKRGGNYASIALNTLEPGQVIRVVRQSGNLKYVTLHGRYQGGIWRTIYQGPITEFPVSQYLSSQMKDSRCTNVVISVNGAHEKYEPIVCEAVVKVCAGKAGPDPVSNL